MRDQLNIHGEPCEDVNATASEPWAWEAARLFEPAPCQMAGQVEMFDPDNGTGPELSPRARSTTTTGG